MLGKDVWAHINPQNGLKSDEKGKTELVLNFCLGFTGAVVINLEYSCT